MLAEKYFPVESSRYKRFVGPFQKLDSFISLSPDRWFSIWTIVLAGANTAAHLENRWVYWDWSTFSYLFIPILVFSIWLDRYFNKLEFFSKNIYWIRLSWNSHSECNFKKYFRKSWLVHSLYPLST